MCGFVDREIERANQQAVIVDDAAGLEAAGGGQYDPWRCIVDAHGEFTRGMTAVDERPIVQSKKEKPNALVAYEPKSAEIFQLIYEALATAPSA